MSAERQLIDAVVDSILGEVPGAGSWTVNQVNPQWRNPGRGQQLNVFCPRRVTTNDTPLGDHSRRIDMIIEYIEPVNPEIATRLDRDELPELDAYDTAASFDDWAQNHRQGFAPAIAMELTTITHVPGQRREMLVRYCSVELQFIV